MAFQFFVTPVINIAEMAVTLVVNTFGIPTREDRPSNVKVLLRHILSVTSCILLHADIVCDQYFLFAQSKCIHIHTLRPVYM